MNGYFAAGVALMALGFGCALLAITSNNAWIAWWITATVVGRVGVEVLLWGKS